MKKYLLILATGMFVTSAWASDFNTTQLQKRQVQAQPREVAIVPQPHGEGAIQWSARLKNPLQGINPLAPAEYGDGSAFVEYYAEYDPFQHTVPGKPQAQGIKFLSFAF